PPGNEGGYKLVIGVSADGQHFSYSNPASGRIIPDAGKTPDPPVNHPPAAHDDAYSLKENQILVVPAPGLLGNDADADGDAMSALPATKPSHGAVTLNLDGSFTYAPDKDYNGADSFTYRTGDGFSQSDVATVHLITGTLYGDLDGDGVVDARDLSAFF